MTSKYERKGKAERGTDKGLLRFGEHVRKLREKLEIDQTSLADRCNRTQPWVSRLERGLLDVNLTNLLVLARALRVSVLELMAW